MLSMDKNIIVIISIFFILIGNCLSCDASSTYKIIRVVDGDTIYVDFNNDGYGQKDEKVRLNGVDAFEVTPSKYLYYQKENNNLTTQEILRLGFLGKKFAEKELLNKRVQVVADGNSQYDKFNRNLVSIIYDNNKNFEEEILKAGLATVYTKSNIAAKLKKYENKAKIKENLSKSTDLKLVILDKKSGLFHKLDCPKALTVKMPELIEEPNIPGYPTPDCCYKKVNPKPLPLIEKTIPDISSQNLKVYFIDGYKYSQPSSACRTSACQALLAEIKQAKKTINFAIYGIEAQSEVMEELYKAQQRGVEVLGVVDKTEKNINIYSDTEDLIRKLKYIKNDYEIADKNVRDDFAQKFDISSAIMHNKFFVFDRQKVFTGSTNISGSGTGGYNTNVALLINSKLIADLYTKEFQQMYNLKFHTIKDPLINNTNIKIDPTTTVSIYFAPKHQVFRNDLHEILSTAKKSIYVEMFYLTNKFIVNDLIAAKARGVDVRVIIDASSAGNKYSGHHALRLASIPVKTENWGGKMHTKGATVDDEYYIIGSMNWTGKAELHNDENLLIISNPLIASVTKTHFFKLWNVIPDKYLTHDPAPEGPESIGSCMDGMDNNHNGYTDLGDFSCRYLLKN